jgi:hypothetical protein
VLPAISVFSSANLSVSQPGGESPSIEEGSDNENSVSAIDVDALQSIMDLVPVDQQAVLLKEDYANLPFLRYVQAALPPPLPH